MRPRLSLRSLESLQSLDAFSQQDEPSAPEGASGSTLMQFCYGYQHVKERSGDSLESKPVCHLTRSEDDRTTGSGARGIRTPDILLAKQALYQLSYGPDKRVLGTRRVRQRWDWEELNLRPHAYQACALTT